MKKYVFKPYLNEFPDLFIRERDRIIHYFKQNLWIEHIGSSSIPGLGGKGIIDIAIGVNADQRDMIADFLQDLGYDFRLSYSTDSRLFFKMQLPDETEALRVYHLHLLIFESQEWLDMLFFRDYLRLHPKDLQKYAQIKEEASSQALDQGEKYRQLKDPFIKGIIKKREGAL